MGSEHLGEPGDSRLPRSRTRCNRRYRLRAPRDLWPSGYGDGAEDPDLEDDYSCQSCERADCGNYHVERDNVGGDPATGVVWSVKVCCPDTRGLGGPVECAGDRQREYCAVLP